MPTRIKKVSGSSVAPHVDVSVKISQSNEFLFPCFCLSFFHLFFFLEWLQQGEKLVADMMKKMQNEEHCQPRNANSPIVKSTTTSMSSAVETKHQPKPIHVALTPPPKPIPSNKQLSIPTEATRTNTKDEFSFTININSRWVLVGIILLLTLFNIILLSVVLSTQLSSQFLYPMHEWNGSLDSYDPNRLGQYAKRRAPGIADHTRRVLSGTAAANRRRREL